MNKTHRTIIKSTSILFLAIMLPFTALANSRPTEAFNHQNNPAYLSTTVRPYFDFSIIAAAGMQNSSFQVKDILTETLVLDFSSNLFFFFSTGLLQQGSLEKRRPLFSTGAATIKFKLNAGYSDCHSM